MIAIGIGAQSTATADDIAAAIARVEQEAGAQATRIATFDGARFLSAAQRAAIPLMTLPLAALQARSAECQTQSDRSLKLFDVASIAEAAALAAAGPGSRLIVPRLVCGNVTAAAAQSAHDAETGHAETRT